MGLVQRSLQDDRFGMWEKELKLLAGLGKLYPVFDDCWGTTINYEKHVQFDECDYYDPEENNHEPYYMRAEWVYWLCRLHLNCRIPRLENFLEENNKDMWVGYKRYFGLDK